MIDKETLKAQYFEVHGKVFTEPNYHAFTLLCAVLDATGDTYWELQHSLVEKIRKGITLEQSLKLKQMSIDSGLVN